MHGAYDQRWMIGDIRRVARTTALLISGPRRINESYVTRLIRLNLLAPDIVEAALNGRTQLTVQDLTESISPVWTEQRTRLARAQNR